MKRLTAIILAAIILLSSFEPVVAAEKSTTESKKIKWMLENNFIVGRGQTKDLKLEDTITRAEFTRMVLVAKGEENLAKEDSKSKADFKDVPNTHWAEKFIAYAKQKGYISGYPDGNFRPEGEITYEEMISILARIHPNYRKIEAKSTNWVEGFINFAKDNGILDDINIKGSYKSPAIREKTFEMIYNFIKFVENQSKSEKVSKAKEEKEVNKESSTWDGFYPYWLGYGFRPSEEKKPDEKPNPDVKPAPDKPEKENPGAETPKPGTEPEAPKEFDKTKIDKVEIVNKPSKLEYTEGEKLDLSGIKLKLIDTQGKDKEIVLEDFSEYGITTDPANETGLSVNENGTTIKIKLNGVEKVETDPLKVNAKVFDPAHVEKMVVKTQPTKLVYTDGEKLNLSGLEVTLTDNQGLTKDVAFADFAANGIEAAPANETALTLTDNAKKVKLTKGSLTAETNVLTVKEKVFDSAHVEKMVVKNQPTKLSYTEGEKLNLAGLEVRLTDNQGLTKDVAFADFKSNEITTDPKNATEVKLADNGSKVKLTKGNLTAETNVLTVKEKVFDPEHVEKMVVKTQPTKLSYTEGEKLDLAGLVVTLTDNQGLTKDVAFKDFADNGITAAPANVTELKLEDNGSKVKLTKGNLTAETEALTVKAKAKFIEVTDTVSPIPEGYERLTFDATAYGKIGSAQVKAFDVLKGTTYDDAELKAKIKEVVAIPTGSTKEFKGWKPEVPLTGNVETKEYKAEYKSKKFDKNNITKIEVITPPTKLNYVVGESLNLDGLKVKLTDNQGVTKEIVLTKFDDYKITTEPKNGMPLTTNENGTTIKIKLHGEEKAGTAPLTVKEKEFDIKNIEEIVILHQPIKTSYIKGEKFSPIGMEIRLLGKDGTKKDGALNILSGIYKYDIVIIPSEDEVLGAEHNRKPITVKLGNLQAKTDLIFVYVKVKFTDLEGKFYDERRAEIGKKVKKPDVPFKKGYKFIGWYVDTSLETLFDFESNLYDNITVYAKWEELK